MNKIKIFICYLLVSGIAFFSLSSVVLAQNNSNSNDKIVSLYCWEIRNFNLSKLKDQVDYLGVNTLYIQTPANSYEKDRLKQIMEFCKKYNIDVFLLDGYYSWFSSEEGFEEAKGLVDLAVELNKDFDYKIKGVSYDVEFYSADEYQSGSLSTQREMFETYIDYNHKAIEYAKANGLAYSAAMPVWFDKLDRNTLREDEEELKNLKRLMNDDYDHIAFMNYARSSMAYNLDDEVRIAKEYGINIVTIVELQSTDYVPKNDTFDVPEDGLGLLDAVKALKDQQDKYASDPYNYNNLGTSYHYYTPIVKLMERDTDSGSEKRYELQVNPIIDGTSVDIDEAYISSDGVTFEPIKGYYNETGKYVLSFYGLEYGKEYTVTVKKGNSIGTETFAINKGDVDKLEIAYKEISLFEQDDNNNDDDGKKDDEEITPPEDDKKDDDEITPPGDDKKDDEEITPPEDDKKDDDEITPPAEDSEDQKDGDIVVPPEKDENKPNDDSNKEDEMVKVPNTNNSGYLYMNIIGASIILLGSLFIKFNDNISEND